ncbi:MAG: hypothetical protein ACRDBG_09795 [Waterburya sp.]
MTNRHDQFGVEHLDELTRERVRTRVVQLKVRGNNFREIAELIRVEFELDVYTHSTAFNDFEFELAISHQQSLQLMEKYRELEDQRLDWLLQRLSRAIDRGDAKAIDSAMKISEQRAKLHGLFKDIQVHVNLIASKQIEIQFNSFFERLSNDSEIDSDTFSRILEHAKSIGDRAEMGTLN